MNQTKTAERLPAATVAVLENYRGGVWRSAAARTRSRDRNLLVAVLGLERFDRG